MDFVALPSPEFPAGTTKLFETPHANVYECKRALHSLVIAIPASGLCTTVPAEHRALGSPVAALGSAVAYVWGVANTRITVLQCKDVPLPVQTMPDIICGRNVDALLVSHTGDAVVYALSGRPTVHVRRGATHVRIEPPYDVENLLVQALCASKDCRIVCASWFGQECVHVYDTVQNTTVHLMPMSASAMAVADDEQSFLLANEDGLYMPNLVEGQGARHLWLDMTPHIKGVACAGHLAAASFDNHVRVYDMLSGERLAEIPVQRFVLMEHLHMRDFRAGGADGEVSVRTLHANDEIYTERWTLYRKARHQMMAFVTHALLERRDGDRAIRIRVLLMLL